MEDEESLPNRPRTMRRKKVWEAVDVGSITFGVEIECYIPEAIYYATGCGGYHSGQLMNHNCSGAPYALSGGREWDDYRSGNSWKVESDSSIEGQCPEGYRAIEIISPILYGNLGVVSVVKMLEWLREKGAKVKTSCGLHVHVGIGSIESAGVNEYATVLGALARYYGWFETAVYAQTGTGRHLHSYSESTRALVLDNFQSKEKIRCLRDRGADNSPYDWGGKYQGLNLQSLRRWGTVEFRAFAGTLNTNKMLHHLWTVLALAGRAGCYSPSGWAKMKRDHKWVMEGQNRIGETFLRKLWQTCGGDLGDAFPIFKERKVRMRREALRLAQKWDERYSDSEIIVAMKYSA